MKTTTYLTWDQSMTGAPVLDIRDDVSVLYWEPWTLAGTAGGSLVVPRIRIRELMQSRHIETGYQLAQELDGKLSPATCYRLVASDGVVGNFSAVMLEALASYFRCDVGDLFEKRERR